MDSEPWDVHRLRLSRSTISQSSDASTSTIVPSPALTNEQHFESFAQSPRAFLSPQNSYTNTPSPSTPGSPHWDRSGTRTYQRWNVPIWKSHVDDGDEELMPLKSVSQEYLPQQKQRSTTDMQKAHGTEHLATTSRASRCTAAKGVCKSRSDFSSIGLLVSSIYSTMMSALWLGLAAKRQIWGSVLMKREGIAPAAAKLAFPFLAKTIEISFVTVFVAYLGQCLSRRAHHPSSSRGVSLAEMSMRTWLTQPSTIFARFENLGHTAKSWLGVASLVAALLATLYTTASNTLVAPVLALSKPEPRILSGHIITSFANKTFINGRCHSLIHDEASGTNCISIEHSGQAFSNYVQYVTQWNNASRPERPRPVGTLFDNTTIKGSWIQMPEVTASSSNHKRILHNVSMAFPHAGVFAAAHSPINNIIQPSDLNRLLEYHISASVSSPALNVLCSNVTRSELSPLVYSDWPDAKGKEINAGTWSNITSNTTFAGEPHFMKRSDLDDVFEFGREHNRSRPIFPKYPKPYNAVLATNISATDSLYILATSPTSTYMMCSMRAFLSSKCSTTYDASLEGGHLTSDCKITPDSLRYDKSFPQARDDLIVPQWSVVAREWAQALGLGSGINDNNGAAGRQLTQLIPTAQTLNPSLPSLAEALGVLAGCTLLLSSLEAPFDHRWTNSDLTLPLPEIGHFNATFSALKSMSGGTKTWQGVLYPILVLTFLINCGCLFHFVRRFLSRDGFLITDFTEPQNVFALAMNSPPSQSLAGACGAGPSKDQFRSRWNIKHDAKHDHYYLSSGFDEAEVEKEWDKPGLEQRSGKNSPVVTLAQEM